MGPFEIAKKPANIGLGRLGHFGTLQTGPPGRRSPPSDLGPIGTGSSHYKLLFRSLTLTYAHLFFLHLTPDTRAHATWRSPPVWMAKVESRVQVPRHDRGQILALLVALRYGW